MHKHTHLPAVVGLMSNHVAQHFRAGRPRRGLAIAAKLFNLAPIPECVCKHFRAAS
jgi:hypothetical protein